MNYRKIKIALLLMFFVLLTACSSNLESEEISQESEIVVSQEDLDYYSTLGFTITSQGALTVYEGDEQNVEIPSVVVSVQADAFYYGTNIISLSIPESVKSIDAAAFSYCTNLEEVYFPESQISIGSGAFWNTKWYENLTDEFCIVGDGILVKYNGTSENIVIPDDVKAISDSVFYYCTDLKSVVIPSSVEVIGNSSFMYCSNLQSVEIQNSSVEIGNFAFSGCNEIVIYAAENSTASEYAAENSHSLCYS